MNSMTKYRERDCEAFQKWRRRQRCRNILRGFKERERVTDSNIDKLTLVAIHMAAKERRMNALIERMAVCR